MSRSARTGILRLRAGLRGEIRILGIRDTPATLRALAPKLTAADRHAAHTLRSPTRRRSFLLGCALLRIALRECTGTAPGRAQLQLRRNRRPLHRPAARGALALSVSHAGGWVIVAVRRGAVSGHRVGIDIEHAHRRVQPGLDRRMPWAHASEVAAVETRAGHGQRIVRWTLVESALKADGRGLPGLGALVANAAPRNGTVAMTMTLPPQHRILARRLSGLPPPLVGAVALARPRARPRARPWAQPEGDQEPSR